MNNYNYTTCMKKMKMPQDDCFVDYEYMISADNDWRLDKAFDLLFQEVMEARKKNRSLIVYVTDQT